MFKGHSRHYMLTRTLLLFLVSILSLVTYATEREIVVLDSIAKSSNHSLAKLQNKSISREIKKEFTNAFYFSDYKLVYHHDADATILSHYLNSPKTLALFWISHAASATEIKNTAISLDSSIQDAYGNDVKNIFQIINPNIRFVSIIGCQASAITNDFISRELYHKNLTLHSFDKKIELYHGIRTAIKESARVLDPRGEMKWKYIKENPDLQNQEIIPAPTQAGIKIYILNSNPEHSAELMVGDKFIGLLNRGIDLQTFNIPFNLLKKRTKLVVTYDKRSIKDKESLTPLHIEDEDNTFEFDYLKDKNGNPYALNKNFYYLIQ